LVNLAQLRARTGLGNADVSDDSKLLAKARAATAEIERFCQREFVPMQAARQFDWQRGDGLTFSDYSLLKLTSIVDSLGVPTPSSAIILEGGSTSGATDTNGPYYGVRIDVAKGSFLVYQTIPTRAITVTGIWGWHDDYANAWRPSANTITAAITDTTTATVSASAPTGTDGWGMSPAISVGDMIQIDSEWLFVVSITGNALTTIRGVQGTTATTHLNGASIQVYAPPSDLSDIAARWASWLFTQDSTDYGQRVFSPYGAMVGIKVPAGVPPDLYQALEPYRTVCV
jgi:hypothetical protein